jgi:3-deoxy-D-manno-octulosonic-acid transferase
MGWQLAAYLAATRALPLLAPMVLRRRLAKGREDPRRWREKLGEATVQRPEGRLVWLHAVGLGEVLALRGLIGAMADLDPDLWFLVTSSARSSAEVMAANLPPRTQHQFLPLDAPSYLSRFLATWRPDLSVWAEQDLWPGAVVAADRAGVPLALVNARMNAASHARRARARGLYRDLLARFLLIAAQDEGSARHLTDLGARGVQISPSLKAAAPPLQADPLRLAALQSALQGRDFWLLASSHPEDEAVAFDLPAGAGLQVIVPRVPGRGAEIAAAAKAAGREVSLASAGGPLARDVHIADAFGELGLWYRLAPVAVMGGTFGPVEGHNPWEAAALGCAVLHGPRVANLAADYQGMDQAGAALAGKPCQGAGDGSHRHGRPRQGPVGCRSRQPGALGAVAAGVDVMPVFLALWSLLWVLGLPFVLFYLWRRGRKDPEYSRHLGQRFGRYGQSLPGAVWVHAVSLGEMRSAVPLVRALLDRGEKVVTTHFTPAGRREATRVFAAEIAAGQMAVVWVPFELSLCYRGFFRAFRPKLGLVMEIEIWPRMVFAARAWGVPLYMCNAQYPSKSIARDARLPLRPAVMRGFAGALVKSRLQADRFAAVGVRNIHVTGELRFDQPIPPALVTAGKTVRPLLAGGRRVVAFASVVEGEDEVYLPLIEAALQAPDAPFVVYIPRKPERFDEVAKMLAARGLRFIRRSQVLDAGLSPSGPVEADLLLGDSLGEMYFYLSLADRVVTSGGFNPKGAHNIIEPLALGKPVLVGPAIHTIEYPAVEAIAAGVCFCAKNPAELGQALSPGGWPGPTPAGIAGFLAAHSGATDKTMAAIQPLLTSR